MENKLIPLTEFVNKIDELVPSIETFDIFQWKCKQLGIIKRYAEFLLQPRKFEYFVPVKDGEVLKEPKIEDYDQEELEASVMGVDVVNYQEAQEKVLFEGFEIETDMHHSTKREIIWLNKPINKVFLRLSFHNGDVKTTFMPDENIKTVEDLLRYNLTLTATALKQIYG